MSSELVEFSLFTVPRKFQDACGVRQHNALGSWIRLEPKPEILLLGDEGDTTTIAEQYELIHIPQVQFSESKIPLLDSVFQLAQHFAEHDIMCYANTDILLFQSFSEALSQVARKFNQFLMIGRRTDLDFKACLEFKLGWQEELTTLAQKGGKPHSPSGIDYFAFHRGLFESMPPFTVGRYGWDNWLVNDVLKRGVPVVDVSPTVLMIHQDHERWPRSGPDFQKNLAFYKRDRDPGAKRSRISDATWILIEAGLRKK